MPQVFDDARPLIVSGDNDKGLEPEPDEPTEDELEFPEYLTDTDKPSKHTQHSKLQELCKTCASLVVL